MLNDGSYLSSYLCEDLLGTEYQDSGELSKFSVYPGLADWDEPLPRVHRGVNVGHQIFEEVVVFFLDVPEMDPQPEPR